MQANKGEWSELYTLLSIFVNNQVPAADKNLEPTGDKYVFLQVLRDDTGKRLIYDLENPGTVVIGEQISQAIKIVPTAGLAEKTKVIFEKIKAGGSAAFAIPEATEVMKELMLTKIKSGSGNKSDLVVIVRDRISARQELGFSIKSQVGSPATLLNPSEHTRFVYKINGFSGDVAAVNSIGGHSKIRDRVQAIVSAGGTFEFVGLSSQTFAKNLRMLDTVMPQILAELLLHFYLGDGASVKELTELDGIGSEYELDQKSVSYKVKNLLRAIALGLVPSKEWDTYLSTYGGYLIVKEDGTLVCYHLYNDDQFKDYLFEHTRFETPSSSRYGFGEIYQKDGEHYFDLNLQIRFVK